MVRGLVLALLVVVPGAGTAQGEPGEIDGWASFQPEAFLRTADAVALCLRHELQWIDFCNGLVQAYAEHAILKGAACIPFGTTRLPPSLQTERAKVATFYVARSEIITPLPWQTFALPLSPRIMVPAFLHVLISSFSETSRRQIVAYVTVRFSGNSSRFVKKRGILVAFGNRTDCSDRTKFSTNAISGVKNLSFSQLRFATIVAGAVPR